MPAEWVVGPYEPGSLLGFGECSYVTGNDMSVVEYIFIYRKIVLAIKYKS